MPVPKSGPALFLGIELSTDQFRASIVDESLELIGVECVDFDTELSEYHTHGGIFTTPGDAYTTPVEMWIKGLDALLEKLARNHDLSRIRAIGGSAQHALVWWKSTTVPSLSSLDPILPFHSHFSAHTFSLPNTPVNQDTASHSHALAIENLVGGPESMAARVGTSATPSMVAAQLLRVRETWPQDVWARTGRIQLASAFLSSLISGKWIPISEAEACATGIWVHGSSLGSGGQGHWDEGILDIVGGSREEGRRVRGWLGDVDASGGGKRVGNVSRYLVERYRFDPDTIVAPFTSDYLANYLSLCPSSNDAVLSFGPMDMLLTPAQHYMPKPLYNLFPHPAQDSGEKRRYIAVLCSRNADVPRALVRDMYTKSWSAFDRLVAIVPPGGSIGLDDKLFSFWHLQADSYPYAHVKGIFRFETGIKVTEFRDLRANPRCLVESQILSFRVKWARMIATGIVGSPRKVNQTPPVPGRSTLANSSSLGLPFDPYDHTPLPTRIITTGAAANFPSVANLVGDVFNSPVFVPFTQVESAQIVPHRNAPAQGFPSRAALGGAYVARWVWGREWGTGGLGVFEDEMRRLLGKRWVATGGMPLRTNINGAVGVGGLLGVIGGGGAPGSGANSGTSTPFGSRSNLGATIFVEEDEDEELERERNERENGNSNGNGNFRTGLGIAPGVGNAGMMAGGPYTQLGTSTGVFGVENVLTGRQRTHAGSTVDTLTNIGSVKPHLATYSSPDPSLGSIGIISPGPGSTGGGPSGTPGADNSGNQPNPTPLTPVVALPTSDSEAQIGLAKVAEPDVDAFMTYAAIVPEYCRLESMVVKGIV